MDTDGTTGDFRTVQHEIIGSRPYVGRIALQGFDVGLERRRERVMHRDVAIVFLVELEEWKLVDPQRLPVTGMQQVEAPGQFQTESAKHARYLSRLVSNEKQQVSRFRLQRLDQQGL